MLVFDLSCVKKSNKNRYKLLLLTKFLSTSLLWYFILHSQFSLPLHVPFFSPIDYLAGQACNESSAHTYIPIGPPRVESLKRKGERLVSHFAVQLVDFE